MSEVKYTEIFKSVQGEAKHTGVICTWLRLFSCSLQCRGFGQKEPWNPDSWEDQRPNIIVTDAYQNLEQVPTPHVGCDSDYSWSAKFKHLVNKEQSIDVACRLMDMMRVTNSKGEFVKNCGHIFTGGEPMMQQKQIVEIVEYWFACDHFPEFIGFETNGTQQLSSDFLRLVDKCRNVGVPLYMSISPKLLHVSGEQPKKAIRLNVIEDYIQLVGGYLKFVLNEDQRAWDQAQLIVDSLDSKPEIWVMPVGGLPGQQMSDATGRIADKAIFEYGWNVSPRVHLMIWGDSQIGR